MERVRQATTEDLDRLVELVAGFVADRSRHRGGDLVRDDDAGGVSPEPVVGSLAAYVSDPGRTALVGTLDDWVAGAALCRVDDGGAGRRDTPPRKQLEIKPKSGRTKRADSVVSPHPSGHPDWSVSPLPG